MIAHADAARTPTGSLVAFASWRLERLRAAREDHVALEPIVATTWRQQARELLQEAVARGVDVREFLYGGPTA